MLAAIARISFEETRSPEEISWEVRFTNDNNELRIEFGKEIAVRIRAWSQEVYLEGKGRLQQGGFQASRGGSLQHDGYQHVIPYTLKNARDMKLLKSANKEIILKIAGVDAALLKYDYEQTLTPIKIELLSSCDSRGSFSLRDFKSKNEYVRLDSVNYQCKGADISYDDRDHIMTFCASCADTTPNLFWVAWSRFSKLSTRTKFLLVATTLIFLITPPLLIYRRIQRINNPYAYW